VDAPNVEPCASCFGKGTQFRDMGPEPCPDCYGLGELPSGSVLRERRLRELEQRYADRTEQSRDLRWLVSEVRRSNHALLQILAASLDASPGDDVAKKIGFLANEVLGLYRPHRVDEDSSRESRPESA